MCYRCKKKDSGFIYVCFSLATLDQFLDVMPLKQHLTHPMELLEAKIALLLKDKLLFYFFNAISTVALNMACSMGARGLAS